MIQNNLKELFCKNFFKNLKNDFAKKIEKNLRKWFCKKFLGNFKKIKNYFVKNFLRNLRMCELLANRIGIRSFFSHVDALQDLTNIEEQPKSFIVHQQEPITK